MLTQNERSGYLAALAQQVRDAAYPSPAMLHAIVSRTCERTEASRQGFRLTQIQHLIDDGGATDAALALIDLEVPSWRLRRLAYDDGRWHCTVSRQRELPDWLDDAIETNHASLPLAIFGTYIEALRQPNRAGVARPCAPATQPDGRERLCCENFS